MNSDSHAAAAVAVMAGVTLLLRVLPFLVFRKRKTPAYVSYLGKYLPYAIMGMLVVYCLKDVSFVRAPFGIPEIAAAALTAGLYVWKRSTLLSIVGGTVFYMLLLRLVV